MLIAVFADIHANRQAFEACLADAQAHGAERYVLLGDYVGYGADPDWCLTTVMDMVDKGAAAVLGNHDQAIGGATDGMNVEARVAIEWTRGELGVAQRAFLANLPLTVKDGDRLYVHGEASHPADWIYVQSTVEASRSLASTSVALTLCGHVHRPALYTLSATAKMTAFTPKSGAPIPITPGRQWLAVLGAVGQPRDGNPAAAYLMLNATKNEITFCRVPYDAEAAANAIRAKGLPTSLAERLLVGR